MWPPVWDYRKSLEARKGMSTFSSRPSAESDSRPLTLTRTLWATRLLFKVTKLGTSLVVRGCDSTLLCRVHPWLVSEDSTCLWPRQQQCKQQKWHCQKFRFAYKSLQPSPTVCEPTDCTPPGSFARGILQARIPEWAATPSSGGPSRPGVEPSPLNPQMSPVPLGQSNRLNKDLKNGPHQKKTNFILNEVSKFMIIIDSSYRKGMHSSCLSWKTKTKKQSERKQ